MRVRIAKLAGDSNKGDYYPDGYWAIGDCDGVVAGELCHVFGIKEDADGVCQSSHRVITPKLSKVIKNINGILLLAEQEMWFIKILK